MPSTRYNEEEECSLVEQSIIEQKKQPVEPKQAHHEDSVTLLDKKETVPAIVPEKAPAKRPKASRGAKVDEVPFFAARQESSETDTAKRPGSGARRASRPRSISRLQPTEPETHRRAGGPPGILSNVERLFGSSRQRANSRDLPGSEFPYLQHEPDLTKDLTKIDFDLTQLNQTQTPRPANTSTTQPTARDHRLEQPAATDANKEMIESNAQLLKEIGAKVERQIGARPEPEVSREYSLSFDTSNVGAIEQKPEAPEPMEEIKECSEAGEPPVS